MVTISPRRPIILLSKLKSKVFYGDYKKMLRSMPLGNNEDLGKGYDDMIGCATCSLSQRLMQ